jgi:hypothetical protein
MRNVAPSKRAFAAQTAASYRPRSAGIPVCDYEVALQSRTNVSPAPELKKLLRSWKSQSTKQRAVAIDYPRS